MNRRNLLIGIGTAAVGSGAVLGSGALTQVSADRTVTIGVDDDSSALLGLSPNSNVPEVTTTSAGEIDFNLPTNLNDEAVTTFGAIGTDSNGNTTVTTPAFTITNNTGSASNSPDLNISTSIGGADGNILSFKTVDGSGTIVELENTSITLSSGNSQDAIVEVDTVDSSADYSTGVDIAGVTFTATTP